jgi:LPXTG-motif cell wall-anchored protein
VNAGQASTTTSAANDQNANANQSDAAAAGADQNNAAQKGSLPQTASPLPLLGLLGFGSTAVGAFLRRRK